MTGRLHGLRRTAAPKAVGSIPIEEIRNPVRDRAAVIVLHEGLGVNDHIEDVLVRFGAAGYHAIAPHLYHRLHVGPIAYGDYDTIYTQIGALRDHHIIEDIDDVVTWFGSEGWSPDQIAIVGFNIGARASFLIARYRRFGAAVGFYGGGIVTPPAKLSEGMPSLLDPFARAQLQTPWLGLYGDADHSIPEGDVDTLIEALDPSKARVEIFPGAGHSFHNDARTDLFHAPAARSAWRSALKWMSEHLARRP